MSWCEARVEAAKAPRLPDRREAPAPDVGFIQWYGFFGQGVYPV